MLLYDRAGLAFIHVPKNGGKSIRAALDAASPINLAPTAQDLGMSVEDLVAAYESGGGVVHPVLGRVKIEHLPLAFWEEHFPQTWAAFAPLKSFVMLREPRDRFFSAVLQRLGEYKDLKNLRADDPQVTEEALRVSEWLSARGTFCDIEYIHFTRQSDYALLRGERKVTALFPIDAADAAALWVKRETGLVIEVAHEHARREPKSWAKSLQPAARFVGRHVIPLPLKRAIYPLWRGSGVFDDASKRYKTIELADEVERFVAEYYAVDAALYREASIAAGRAG
jgi:hypothetical protein